MSTLTTRTNALDLTLNAVNGRGECRREVAGVRLGEE